MTLQQKLTRREAYSDRCREEAMTCFRCGMRMDYVQIMMTRYYKAAVLVDLTGQKLLEERGR